MKKWIAVMAMMWIGSGFVVASPTFYGPTGLIEMPTAASLKYKEINFAYDYVSDNSDKSQNYRYKMNMGTFQNWEIGVVGGKVPTEGMFLNAKYHLMSEDTRTPMAMAVGVQNLGSKSMTDLYMVMSWKIRQGLNIHGGFKETFSEVTAAASAMGGIEYFLNSNASVLSDITIHNDGTTVLNAGAEYYVSNDMSFRVSLLDLTNANRTGSALSGGLAISRFL